MEKYFKIGEISKLYNIGVDSLRYYEECGVITPKRSESGYRLYSVSDIWRLNVVRELLGLGFHMEQIRQYLDCHTVESTLSLLEQEQRAIRQQMEKLQKLQKNVEKRMQTIEKARVLPLGQIQQEICPLRRCFSISEGYQEEHEMDVLIKRLLNLDKRHFYVIGSNQIGTVISREKFEKSGKIKNQSVFLMDDNGTEALPGGRYLSVSYAGDYESSGLWAEKLLAYAKNLGKQPQGDFLEILWIDNHTTSDVQQQITQLQLRIED